MLTMTGMNPYIFPYYFKNTAAQSAVAMCSSFVSLLIVAPLATVLASKIGKKETAIAGSLFGAAVYLVCFILHPESGWVYLGFYTVAYAGLGLFNTIVWAMITDVIDDSEVKNGVREDGTIYSVYSFARKLGQAFSAGLIGALLGLIGYSTATQQDPAVLSGIYNIASKKVVDGNVETLKARRAGK